MIEIAAVTYGFLISFVLSSIYRNNRNQQVHPPVLVLAGYFLYGFTAAGGICLLAWVLLG